MRYSLACEGVSRMVFPIFVLLLEKVAQPNPVPLRKVLLVMQQFAVGDYSRRSARNCRSNSSSVSIELPVFSRCSNQRLACERLFTV